MMKVPGFQDKELKCHPGDHGWVLGWEGAGLELGINVKAQTRSKRPVSWGNELNQEGNFVSKRADNPSIFSGRFWDKLA